MTKNHTPTPWRVGSTYKTTLYSGAVMDLYIVAECADLCNAVNTEQEIANAAFICRAVNSHDALVEALQAASDHLDYCGYGDKWERECAQAGGLEAKITKALELAKC